MNSSSDIAEGLKPCPFCGGEADAISAVGETWVRCMACEASGPSSSNDTHAITAWNTRPPTLPADGAGEAVAWERAADEITGLLSTRITEIAFKASQDIYADLLSATQDYLADNTAFNLKGQLEAAERDRASSREAAIKFRALLTRSREYVYDALEAYEHSDGRDLLAEIDEVLR